MVICDLPLMKYCDEKKEHQNVQITEYQQNMKTTIKVIKSLQKTKRPNED